MSIVNKRSYQDITDFIFVEDEPVKADLILIPGAPIKELAYHAAALWKAGYADTILATGKYYFTYENLFQEFEKFTGDGNNALGEETEAQFLKKLLIGHGVSESAIITEEESMNTFENAINAAKLFKEKYPEVKHIILACQAFHARRALMTFQSELRDIEITVCPVVTRGYSRDTWMDTQKGYNLIMGELRKCGEYFTGERMYRLC